MEKQVDVVVIGAGLTGLTTAFYLKKSGLSVAVIERSSRIGGVIQTVKEDGFIFETGPNTGVIAHPEVAELFEDLAPLCTLETANLEAKKRLILQNGRWEALPSGLWKAVKTPLFTFKDKLRLLGEPFRKRGNNPFESIAELVKRRMGVSFLNYAVDPFISGIYAGEPSKLVTKYALPKLYMLEQDYGSFIVGGFKKSFAKKEPRMSKATREVFAAKGGLGSMISALGSSIGSENIHLSSELVIVSKTDVGYITSFSNINQIHSKWVVSTADAEALPSIFPFIPTSTLKPIEALRYAAVTQVILGYKKWSGCDVNAFGGLIPTIENRKILGVLFTSSFFGNRAPDGGVLLSVFMGGVKRPEVYDMSDEAIKTIVLDELKDIMELQDATPDLIHIYRYKRAIPQYEASTKERLEAIQEIQEQYPNLILSGAIRDGIGMADRIKQARMVADDICGRNH